MRACCVAAGLGSLCLLALAPIGVAHAQAAGTNALGQCLIRSTTPTDRRVLVRWAFATVALDPDVADLAAVSPAQRDELSRKAGVVVTNLLASACTSQAQQALASGGPQAITAAFTAWGEWAVTGLVAQPAVAAGMGSLLQYIDLGKLMTTLMPLTGLPAASGTQ